jgi:exosortase
MTPSSPENNQDPVQPSAAGSALFTWIAALATIAVVVWYFCIENRFGPQHSRSTLSWLWSSWNPSTDYEHGRLIPFIIAGLLIYRLKDLKSAISEGSAWGYLWILIGCLFYVIGYRTIQPRIAIVAFPLILWGSAYAFWGWRVAKLSAFPLFFLLIAIPLPSFQQATTQLQLLATSLAHHGSGLCGVETYTQGTTILPVHGDWKPLSIAQGCSGIRSLMALLMISAAWAYMAKMAMWKRVLLFLCAFPLAIIGNALRVISIFVIAQYGDAKWATTTWHDWSGLLLFYPFSLALLLAIHSVLEGGLPWKSQRRQVRRTVVVKPSSQENSTLEP